MSSACVVVVVMGAVTAASRNIEHISTKQGREEGRRFMFGTRMYRVRYVSVNKKVLRPGKFAARCVGTVTVRKKKREGLTTLRSRFLGELPRNRKSSNTPIKSRDNLEKTPRHRYADKIYRSSVSEQTIEIASNG